MNRLYFFNPGHEEALAQAEASSYTPKREVQQMMQDLGELMLLLCDATDYVALLDRHSELRIVNSWGEEVAPSSLPKLELTLWALERHALYFVKKKAEHLGLNLGTPLISGEYLRVSHRQSATRLMQHCVERGWPLQEIMPEWHYFSEELELNLEKRFTAYCFEGHSKLMLKRPYTSSGRGVMRLDLPLEHRNIELLCAQCRRSGGISLEPWLEIEQDWAVEYYYAAGEVTYVGLSKFQTKQGQGLYEGNLLASDAQLRAELIAVIGQRLWEELLEAHQSFLRIALGADYSGYIGIDMCLYWTEQGLRLHPAVEINARCTMGVLAHMAYLRHIAPIKETGVGQGNEENYSFCLKYFREKASAYCLYERHQAFSGSGFATIPLTHPSLDSHFYAYLEVGDSSLS